MLAYTENENGNLIITTQGNMYSNTKLLFVWSDANDFHGRDTRFYHIISKNSVSRNFRHLTKESMRREAMRLFNEKTQVYNSYDYVDERQNIGYRLYPYHKDGPTIYTYKILYPVITEFFQYWVAFNKDMMTPQYDLSRLISNMDNFDDLSLLFSKKDEEKLSKELYQNFPEFAIFYYEIYPYIDFNVIGNYDIAKLVNARLHVSELGLDTEYLDQLVDSIPIAEHNTKILKLIREKGIDDISSK